MPTQNEITQTKDLEALMALVREVGADYRGMEERNFTDQQAYSVEMYVAITNLIATVARLVEDDELETEWPEVHKGLKSAIRLLCDGVIKTTIVVRATDEELEPELNGLALLANAVALDLGE